jgi:predicted SAM-dependent methyltransferase
MVAAMNSFEPLSFKHLVSNKKVLHFAPEPLLSPMLKFASNQYLTADFARDDTDLQLDMCDMQVLEDSSIDLIIACDVLEHVSNDTSAIKELFRVLKPNGWAILTVPQKDGLAQTFEDNSITTESGRLEAFGQEDHLRIYGDNFPTVLQTHNFAVTTIDEQNFNDETVKINVLFPPVLSSHPLATNYRKVFFAQKPS